MGAQTQSVAAGAEYYQEKAMGGLRSLAQSRAGSRLVKNPEKFRQLAFLWGLFAFVVNNPVTGGIAIAREFSQFDPGQLLGIDLARHDRAQANMVGMVIGVIVSIVVAAILGGFLLSVAIDAFLGVETTEWDDDLQDLWDAIPIILLAVFLIAIVMMIVAVSQ